MPLDPTADIGRRAWLSCPNCGYGDDCAACQEGRTCDEHWQYLLSNEATVAHLQCPRCTVLWSHDSRNKAKSSG